MSGPAPSRVNLSSEQQDVLLRIKRREKCEQRLLRRVKIILMAGNGLKNKFISQKLGLTRDTVRLWRNRWHEAVSLLELVEKEETSRDLEAWVQVILSDEPRPGAPAKFSPEQFCQLTALACENPEASGRPITHWTAKELSKEAIKRGIVPAISSRTVGRFFGGGRHQTSPEPVLAQQ